jgi:hypothetical protein
LPWPVLLYQNSGLTTPIYMRNGVPETVNVFVFVPVAVLQLSATSAEHA